MPKMTIHEIVTAYAVAIALALTASSARAQTGTCDAQLIGTEGGALAASQVPPGWANDLPTVESVRRSTPTGAAGRGLRRR